jgi:hypothetical protein
VFVSSPSLLEGAGGGLLLVSSSSDPVASSSDVGDFAALHMF